MLPASIFENPRAPCKSIVRARLEHLLGEAPQDEDLGVIMIVIKRIQRYQIAGRRGLNASSLDLTSELHLDLLQQQAGRCSVCGYKFKDQDLDEDESADILARVDHRLSTLDRSPVKLHRKAVLDHILPVYLAGDSPMNWQILCKSCNSGKGDSILGFDNGDWFGSTRGGRLTDIGPRMFYMVLMRDGGCRMCARTSHQVELRVRRRDPLGTDVYSNLIAACADLITRNSCQSANR